MALVDTNGNGTVEIALPTGTPHNGASANGTTDGELWAVVLNENGTALFKTNNLAGRTGVDGALWPIITDIDDDEYHDEIIYLNRMTQLIIQVLIVYIYLILRVQLLRPSMAQLMGYLVHGNRSLQHTHI